LLRSQLVPGTVSSTLYTLDIECALVVVSEDVKTEEVIESRNLESVQLETVCILGIRPI